MHKLPYEVLTMTLGDLQILSHYEEPGKSKQATIGLMHPEEAAFARAQEYNALPAREKIRKRIQERDE